MPDTSTPNERLCARLASMIGPSEPTDVCAYQSPGGLWDGAEASSGRPQRCLHKIGMDLEERHREYLMPSTVSDGAQQAWDDAQRPASDFGRQILKDILERGLLYEGQCPRCKHWMHARIAFGLLVENVSGRKGIGIEWTRASGPFQRLRHAGRREKPVEPVGEVTFVCSCGEPHEGRPDDAVFAGCGAVWRQPALKKSPYIEIKVKIGTPEDALLAEQARLLSQRSLDRIREQANRWRTASGSVTAVLGAAAIIAGRQTEQSLHWSAIGVALGGFFLLLIGTGLSTIAANAVNGYDRRFLVPTVLSGYERERGAKAIQQMQWSILALFSGVVVLVVAGVLALKA